MSDNRPIAYNENGTWVVRASAIGRSARCLSAAMQGYDPLPAPEYLLKAAEAGNRYEEIVKDRLVGDLDFKIVGEQDTLEVPIGPNTIVRGHLDAWTIIHPDHGDRMLEVKSMSKRVFEKWTRSRFDGFPEYGAQLSVYMRGTGKKAIYAVICRDDDYMEVIPVDEPPIPWAALVRKVSLAVKSAESRTLPHCDSTSPYACPYDYLCDRKKAFSDEIESGTNEVLARLGAEYDEIRELEAELKSRKAAAREDILVALGDKTKVHAEGWGFSLAESKRKKLNTRKLRDRLGAELDDYYDESTSTTLRVTKLGV